MQIFQQLSNGLFIFCIRDFPLYFVDVDKHHHYKTSIISYRSVAHAHTEKYIVWWCCVDAAVRWADAYSSSIICCQSAKPCATVEEHNCFSDTYLPPVPTSSHQLSVHDCAKMAAVNSLSQHWISVSLTFFLENNLHFSLICCSRVLSTSCISLSRTSRSLRHFSNVLASALSSCAWREEMS